jgi:hypothetical protein
MTTWLSLNWQGKKRLDEEAFLVWQRFESVENLVALLI